MMELRAEAPAKVNLALAVTGRRDDGYHTLRSVFMRLSLHDSLTVEVDAGAPADHLVVDGAALDAGPTNLVLRAAALLRTTIGGDTPPLRYTLTKRIPIAAGLGGGSADGAAALDLAAAAWGVRLHPTARLEAALQLGADVPFFAAGHVAALVSGIGQGLQPLRAPAPQAGILLVIPAARLTTAEVFAEYDREPMAGAAAMAAVDEMARALAGPVDGATLATTIAAQHDANDLWPPAARMSPELVAEREAIRARLGKSPLLTGSGSALFAVFPSAVAAAEAADQMRTSDPSGLAGATIIATATAIEGADS